MRCGCNSRQCEGLRNTREIFRWPQTVARMLAKNPEGLCRLQSVLHGGVVIYSDYSGYGAEREALSCTLQALQEQQKWTFEPEKSPLNFARVCDIAELPQRALISVSQESFAGSTCVFEDVIDHAAPAASQWARAAKPPKDATADSARQQYIDHSGLASQEQGLGISTSRYTEMSCSRAPMSSPSPCELCVEHRACCQTLQIGIWQRIITRALSSQTSCP